MKRFTSTRRRFMRVSRDPSSGRFEARRTGERVDGKPTWAVFDNLKNRLSSIHFVSQKGAEDFARVMNHEEDQRLARLGVKKKRKKKARDPEFFVSGDPSRSSKSTARLRRLPGPTPKMTYAIWHPTTNEKKVYKGLKSKDACHRQAVAWAKRYGKNVKLSLLSSNAWGARPFKVTAKGKWISKQSVKNPKAKRRPFKYKPNGRGGWTRASKRRT